ncbi:MFS transporter [Variovorax sp. J22P271]|uniref:MFS transporter n=1 Tax=Variovorax davisae TaxID=3053515 RepID=UPI00257757BD|nr:MFS transporter [Variovorax sp. J22P271]MDM0035224.1 MFS transporter [Variovorax sp. J22P271]
MLVLTLVLAALDQTILSTALPVMARELPGGWPLAWVFSAYLLAATVVIALYGRLADLLGRKPMLLLAIGLFLLGSLACGASHDLRQLVLARALQGAGGGGLMTLAMLTVPDLFGPDQRGRYQALLGATYGVATMLGPLVGGALVQYLSWHWAFWLNVPLAALAWGVLALTLPPKQASPLPGPRPRIDGLGAVLLAAALVSLLLATQHDRLDLPERVSLGLLLALGAKFTLAFVWRQRRAAHPLLPLSLFARPAYAAACFIGLTSGVALYAAVVFLPQYLQNGLHLSPTASAWHLLPLMAGITVAAVACGKLLRAQTPAAALARLACALVLLSMGLLIAALHWLPRQPAAISAGLLPLGLGLGLLFPIVTVVAQRVSPVEHMGIATAAPIMLRSLGGAAGVALLAAPGHGLQPVFACVGGVVLVALVACRGLPRGGRRPAAQRAGLPQAAS